MLTFEIQHQQAYSRGQLLLRVFLGWLYIVIPHAIVLFFMGIVLWFMMIAAFFIIVFTGVTPKWFYEWVVKLNRWGLRLGARIYNLADGYPAFGMEAKDDKTTYDLAFWQVGRGQFLLRVFLGWLYVGIPHGFVLYFRSIGTCFLIFLAFFAVLFTGNYPLSWHQFNTGTLRWQNRVNLYIMGLYRDYPPFAGKPDPAGSFEFEGNKPA